MDLAGKVLEQNDAKVAVTNDLIQLADLIIEASINWTGEDEEKAPILKKTRTLAGYFKDKYTG